ncbi:MAG: YheU family protein [Deltaproteobacteria bacterium]|nr:YheU family protein [Deltaproteobacteria bacterium]MBW2385099.1 YheU family protein [Deltaproteobacteria bacterium]MBW2695995.1 YheU family protein [Deltaproteobacteria bacterium]
MSIPERAVEVPYAELAPETLRNLAEEFVTRDGTDYGAVEKTLGEKVERLMRQLASGDAHIFFDSETETINIVARRELG